MLRAIRRDWLFPLVIAACVCLDFSCPFVPGAFVFDANQSVDGVVTDDPRCWPRRPPRRRAVSRRRPCGRGLVGPPDATPYRRPHWVGCRAASNAFPLI